MHFADSPFERLCVINIKPGTLHLNFMKSQFLGKGWYKALTLFHKNCMKMRSEFSYLRPIYDRHSTSLLVSLQVINNLEFDLEEFITITEY